MKSVLITDTYNMVKLPLSHDKIKDFIINDDSDGAVINGGALIVRMAASHWGYINLNGFMYDVNTVDSTLPTWTKPYNKPVLGFHPDKEDGSTVPLGRILSARYVKGVARDFIEDSLIPDNVPDGHFEFLTRIPDPVAAKRIIDGIYDTVSISAVATNIRCSVCGKSVISDAGDHEHTRMRWYEQDDVVDGIKTIRSQHGVLCYYIAGPLLGRHVAFVNTPSDQYAGVKGYEYETVLNAGNSTRMSNIRNESAEMELYVLSDKNKLFMSLSDGTNDNLYDRLRDELRIVDGSRTIIDMMVSLEEATREYVSSKSFIADTERNGGVMDKGTEGSGAASNPPKVYSSDDIVSMTDAEIDALVSADESALAEDAKLSYQQRKKLPDSAFCGPDRSFPAHDAAHVRNGLARLNQSNLSPSQKRRVLACLRRRAKKFGIEVSTKVKDSGNDNDDAFVIESVEMHEILLSRATIDDILALEIVQKYISENYINKDGSAIAIDADTCPIVGDKAAGDKAADKQPDDKPTTGDTSNDNVSNDNTTNNNANTTDANTASSEATLDAAKLDAVKEEVKNLTLSNADLFNKLKQSIVDRIVDHKLYTRKLMKGDVDAYRADLMSRSMESLNDTLKDLVNEAEVYKPEETVTSKQAVKPDSAGNKSWLDSISSSGAGQLKDVLPWIKG